MKKTVFIILTIMIFTVLITNCVFAGEKTNKPNEAEFKAFYAKFKKAVKAKDKAAVKSMMGSFVSYSFGASKFDPDSAIKHIDKYKLWKKFAETLDKGYIYSKDLKGYVAPPAYVKDENYMGYRAGFSKKNGKWQLIFFITGD